MTAVTYSAFDKNTRATEVASVFADSIKDRTILITGINKAGIGFGTAKALATQSPRCIILAGRSSQKVNECRELLHDEHSDIDIRPLMVDLAFQLAVREAAKQVLAWTDIPAIHLVINNAGVMRHGETVEDSVPIVEDGTEEMFAVNHIGHFLFTNLIMPKITAAAETGSRGSVRIINLSSSGTWVSPLRTSDLGWEKPASQFPEKERPNFPIMKLAGIKVDEHSRYVPTAAYGQSKTCNILFSVGSNQRLFENYGVLSLAVNPGDVKTELARNTDSDCLNQAIKKREEMGLMHWKTQDQGASTTLVAACDPRLSLPGKDGEGCYLSDCQIAKAPRYAVDHETADELWRISEEMTGQNFSS